MSGCAWSIPLIQNTINRVTLRFLVFALSTLVPDGDGGARSRGAELNRWQA
ncbi:MAG: hypothetical protein WDM81_03240 [Rhizomicrobium sp.]